MQDWRIHLYSNGTRYKSSQIDAKVISFSFTQAIIHHSEFKLDIYFCSSAQCSSIHHYCT